MRALLGRIISFISWPILYKMLNNTERPRLIILSEGKVILVRAWIGIQEWSFPGGGRKNSETAIEAAVREVEEELGIKIDSKKVRDLGLCINHSERGFAYDNPLFVVDITGQPELHPTRELLQADYFDLHLLPGSLHHVTKKGLSHLEAYRRIKKSI